MIAAVPADKASEAVELLNNEGEKAWILGSIQSAADDEAQVIINE